jgi:hypothetical protein
MADISDKLSKLCNAKDFDKPMLVCIAAFDTIMVNRKEVDIITVEEIDDPIPLSKTALRQLSALCNSKNTDDWVGCTVVVFNDHDVEYDNEKIGGIRFRAPKKGHERPRKVPAKPVNQPKAKDDVPF